MSKFNDENVHFINFGGKGLKSTYYYRNLQAPVFTIYFGETWSILIMDRVIRICHSVMIFD